MNKTVSKQNRNKPIDNKERTDDHQMAGGLGEWVKKVKGIKKVQNDSYKNSYGGVKYSIGNIAIIL